MATATIRMNGGTRALAVALTFIAALTFATRAEALPAKFWGVVPQSTLSTEQFQRLGQGGVESMRISFDWGSLQPQEGGPIEWAGPDATVERAALAGIDVLATITNAPSWAVPSARVPGGGGSTAPARLPVSGAAAVGWKSLLGQAVERYGPNGAFWATHPGVPPRPIRVWQIWNEPNFKYFVAKPNPAEYGKLVKLSYPVLKSVDRGAKVLLAGLFARPKGARTKSGKHKSLNWFASDFVARMYATNRGIKSRFNGVSLHPYSFYSHEIPDVIEELRSVLAENRELGKGLWMTELGWSSGEPTRTNLFAKGLAGQAKQLSSAFNLLRRNQAKWRVKGLYWFSVDDATGVCNFCDGSGLFGPGFTPKESWFAYVRFAGGTP
jgi:polysaccharide biosynthesis protein PslG